MFFSTVFQLYQDDGRVIMKGCVQWNPVYIEKITLGGARTQDCQISRPGLNLLS